MKFHILNGFIESYIYRLIPFSKPAGGYLFNRVINVEISGMNYQSFQSNLQCWFITKKLEVSHD